MKKTTTVKKIFFVSLALIISFSFLFSSPRATLADQASLSLSPINGSPQIIDNAFSVNVWAKTGGAKIDTIRAWVSFSADLLEAQSVTLGSTYSVPSGGNYINNNSGVIYWGAGAYGGTTSDATFATIIFKVKSNGTASVSLTNGSYMISAGQAVPSLKTSSTYTIVMPAKTPSPTPPAPAQPIVQPVSPPQQPTPVTQTLTPKTISNEITSISKDNDTSVFEGKSSVGSAEIRFEIEGGLASSTIQSDENGNWKWTTPEGLAPGKYILKITAIHPEDTSATSEISQDFEVTVTEALEVLFDVILDVKRDSKTIKAGEALPIHVKLLNFGENITANSITNVTLTYIVENANKQSVLKIKENRSVLGRESDFDRTIQLPKDLKPGQYSIFAQMNYGENQEASSSDGFEVVNPFSMYSLAVAIATIILLILITSIFRAWRKKPKRKQPKRSSR